MPKISLIIQLYGGFDTERPGFSDFQRYSVDRESRGRGPAFNMREVHCGGTLIPTSVVSSDAQVSGHLYA